MDHGLSIVIANVRGLNGHARRTSVRLMVDIVNASIACLQETNMNLICSSTVLETLGSEYDDYVYLPVIGTRDDILLAWKSRAVTITDPLFSTNTITVKVSTIAGTPWWMIVVCGPQTDADKIMFLQELRDVRADCRGPWMLCGDFNLMYRNEDRNNGNLNMRMMGRFRRLLSDLALKEVYIVGGRYTWSNQQSPPILVRLDRILCTADWEDAHVDCNPLPVAHSRFHFEEFWLRMDGFLVLVTAA